MSEELTTEQAKPVDHEVLIDQAKVVEGENTLFCVLCGASLTLIYRKDEGYSLRAEDAANPLLGGIKITYVEEQHG